MHPLSIWIHTQHRVILPVSRIMTGIWYLSPRMNGGGDGACLAIGPRCISGIPAFLNMFAVEAPCRDTCAAVESLTHVCSSSFIRVPRRSVEGYVQPKECVEYGCSPMQVTMSWYLIMTMRTQKDYGLTDGIDMKAGNGGIRIKTSSLYTTCINFKNIFKQAFTNK